MAETTKVPAIYGAMGKVFAGVATIPKTGTMNFGTTKYDYLKADDVQERLNPLLSENNIIVSSSYTTRDLEKGNRWWVYVDLDLRYHSTVDGSVFPPLGEPPIRATGESVAGDDKSVNKALTQAIKNAHRATFQFASGEKEPDDITPGDEAKASVVQTKIAAARQATTTPSTDTPSQATIRKEWVTPKKITGARANELREQAEAEGLKGEAAYKWVLDGLTAGTLKAEK